LVLVHVIKQVVGINLIL